MPPENPNGRQAAGRERLAARARSVGRIRRRVAAATVATFLLAWGAIAHGGSMGTDATTTTAATPTTSATTTDDSTQASDTTTTASPSPVTTSQS